MKVGGPGRIARAGPETANRSAPRKTGVGREAAGRATGAALVWFAPFPVDWEVREARAATRPDS
jgi:hypothetical protein